MQAAVMQDLISTLALALAVFFSLKFLYWINAKIFLSLMGRSFSRRFWRFTLAEMVLSALTAFMFSYSLINKADGTIFPLIFIASSIAYIFYTALRVWSLSKPRGGE